MLLPGQFEFFDDETAVHIARTARTARAARTARTAHTARTARSSTACCSLQSSSLFGLQCLGRRLGDPSTGKQPINTYKQPINNVQCLGRRLGDPLHG